MLEKEKMCYVLVCFPVPGFLGIGISFSECDEDELGEVAAREHLVDPNPMFG